MKLTLDFNKNSPEERIDFLQTYIENNSDFSEDNLEMMANYILWAVEKQNNEDFQIESKNSPWSKKRQESSYEALLAQEKETGFPVQMLFANTPQKVIKNKLDREEIRKKLLLNNKPHPLYNVWNELWKNIDITEYQVQYWEKIHGKRREDLPIREELINRLKEISNENFDSFINKLQEESLKWDKFYYLKKKRSLVQLRTEQYILLDFLGQEPILKHSCAIYWEEYNSGFTNFYPFMDTRLMIDDVKEEYFKDDFQNICLKNLKHYDERPKNNILNLMDVNIMRQLILNKKDLEESVSMLPIQEQDILEKLIIFINYYISKCNFPDYLQSILEDKMNKVSNREISEKLLKQYNIHYQENYISTIFTKRIIEEIVRQVELHYKLIECIIMGRTVFKKCSKCGKLLPRNSTYYNKRTSTSDGYFSYCKKCKAGRK